MENIKKLGLAFAGFKLGQQMLHDLDSIILNNTKPDYFRYGLEQTCRVSASGIAAYTIDNLFSYAEEYLPKPIRGIFPFILATIGTATFMNYFGDYINIESHLGVIETTKQLIQNYQENLNKLISFDPTLNAGYLTGGFLCIKSGSRFIKNLATSLIDKAENKRKTNYKKRNLENID